MRVITKRKLKNSSIDDIIELERKRMPDIHPDYISNATNLMILHTTDYIKEKFGLTDKYIARYRMRKIYKGVK